MVGTTALLISLLSASGAAGCGPAPAEEPEKHIVFETDPVLMAEGSSESYEVETDGLEIRIFLDGGYGIADFSDDEPAQDAPLEEAQEWLAEKRKLVSAKNLEYNLAAIEEIEEATGLKGLEPDKHVPYVTYELDSEEELTADVLSELEDVLNDDKFAIDQIYVTEIAEAIPQGSLSETFEKVDVADMVQSREYTGNAIRFGIVDVAS